jgi:hypothetical protein
VQRTLVVRTALPPPIKAALSSEFRCRSSGMNQGGANGRSIDV